VPFYYSLFEKCEKFEKKLEGRATNLCGVFASLCSCHQVACQPDLSQQAFAPHLKKDSQKSVPC
jgi:hypothetical protein